MKSIGNDYIILKRINNGFTSTIFLVKSIKNDKIYAAKVYDQPSKYFINEVKNLKKLSSLKSNNIIHIIDYGEEQILIDGIPENVKKQYIIMNYIPNKNLLHYITHTTSMDEKKVKYIFSKILKAVEQCHNQGICHRDLKLENILLNENNEPVLSDFGYSGSIEGENGSRKLTEFLGTKIYAAPELLKQIPYYGIKCDIFCLGVILFALLFGNFGFEEATQFNNLYKLIIKKKYQQYWEDIGKRIGNKKINKISPEFKKLYFKMVAYNPNERPSIKDILNDELMKNM